MGKMEDVISNTCQDSPFLNSKTVESFIYVQSYKSK